MRAEQERFKNLVSDALSGKLRLPEFQRRWTWNPGQVTRLFDSIRKNYPIGSFLTLEASDSLNLSPRLFEGVREERAPLSRYVLDGQQRITAGLALYYGKGRSHYFLNLDDLWQLVTDDGLDLDDKDSLEQFANGLDHESKYIKRINAVQNPMDYLRRGLLWTVCLADDTEFSKAKEQYLAYKPDRGRFMERLIWPFFRVGSEPIVPVTGLDSDMPLEVITRVFETLNTSGQRLTPVEIVVALLYSQGIHLRSDLAELRDSAEYYSNIDPIGELFLQTVALLDGKSPQGTALPRNISAFNYAAYKDEAFRCLERAGDFLSERFGMGLKESSKYVPYAAMLPPLGIALRKIEREFSEASQERSGFYQKMERWFVGAVISAHYTESQPRTQRQDVTELMIWIEYGYEPAWLSDVRVGSLRLVSPGSAIGKLLNCLISRQSPLDPRNKVLVGGSGTALIPTHAHHIFPKAFCEDHTPGWIKGVDRYDLALNVMPVTRETNLAWHKMNPTDQVNDVKNRYPAEVTQLYAPFFVDEACIALLLTGDKRKEHFDQFVMQRSKLIQEYIGDQWGFSGDTEPVEEEEDEALVEAE